MVHFGIKQFSTCDTNIVLEERENRSWQRSKKISNTHSERDGSSK